MPEGDTVHRTARRLEQTLVLVTHDAQVASAAHEVLFLADGSFVSHLMSPTAAQIRTRLEELSR